MNNGDSRTFWKNLRAEVPPHVLYVVDHVWANRKKFIEWPQAPADRCFWAGCTREDKYHKYPPSQQRQLREAKIRIDGRANGPAIMAYLWAGGVRPDRVSPGRGWSIHHIYDGKFPAPGHAKTVRAVLSGKLFTHPAGLVAVHPVADALADEVPYFAWLLRYEAYCRFGFNPDNVFHPRFTAPPRLRG